MEAFVQEVGQCVGLFSQNLQSNEDHEELWARRRDRHSSVSGFLEISCNQNRKKLSF